MKKPIKPKQRNRFLKIEYDWNDPEINIKWPIDKPIVSEKDQKLPLLKNADNNFEYQ